MRDNGIVRSALVLSIVAVIGCDRVFGLEREPLTPGTWASVSSGDRHTCAIRLDGTLWCWGTNDTDQLGLLSFEALTPAQVGTAQWQTVASGIDSTCGIQADGSLWCWGANADGQLGLGDDLPRKEPTRILLPGPWLAVDVGSTHACAIHADTTLWCWGSDVEGQVGNGPGGNELVPFQVTGVGWVSITASFYHTCGIQTDDSLWCWGDNSFGVLADPNSPSQHAPHRAPGSWTKVSSGFDHTCALSTTGQLRCWGRNQGGQLGNGTTTDLKFGTPVGADANDWVDVDSGVLHVCALRRSGSMHCWGDNRRGQVPNPDVGAIASVPTEVTATSAEGRTIIATWTQLSLGSRHTCAIDDGHRLWCVGANGALQLGQGTPSHISPTLVPGEWTELDAGEGSTCALDASRELWCWGRNEEFQLGDSSGLTRQLPTAIDAAGEWDALTVGANYACARKSGQRTCWGKNNLGQLGDRDTGTAFLPKVIADGFWPSTATHHSCGIKDGDIYCWGLNAYGELGNGLFGQEEEPGRIFPSVIAVWTAVVAGGNHSCAIGSSGTYCWGRNDAGQVGNGTTTDVAMALQTSTVIFDTIAAGFFTNCALKNGVASCWGSNLSGQIGNGTVVSEKAPIEIEGRWKQLSLSATHTCGVREDRSLACWGANSRGKLGDGTFAPALTPRTVGVDKDWARVEASEQHTCALKIDGSLWCWGQNDNGEIGDGTGWFTRFALVP
jgi:alpha-tubulin suppressor-like RCC1 family protein